MDPILWRGTSIQYGARPRAVSLAGRPLPANPHESYPLVYAKVALADAVALRICNALYLQSARGGPVPSGSPKAWSAMTKPEAREGQAGRPSEQPRLAWRPDEKC
jgi:hypothetical protein